MHAIFFSTACLQGWRQGLSRLNAWAGIKCGCWEKSWQRCRLLVFSEVQNGSREVCAFRGSQIPARQAFVYRIMCTFSEWIWRASCSSSLRCAPLSRGRTARTYFQVPGVFLSAWAACRPRHSRCVGERRGATGGQRGGDGVAAASAPSQPPGGRWKQTGAVWPAGLGADSVFSIRDLGSFLRFCVSGAEGQSHKKKRNFESLLRMLGEILGQLPKYLFRRADTRSD